MDMCDEITSLLAKVSGSTINYLCALFFIDTEKKKVDELKVLCKVIKLLNCFIELKTEFHKSIM